MNQLDTSKVTRVEVIDNEGRSYSKWEVYNVRLDLQDENRTLKIFLHETIIKDEDVKT